MCLGSFVWDPLHFLSWMFVSFFKFGMHWAIISSNIFSIPFFISFSSKILLMCRLAFLIWLHRSLILLSFLFVFLSDVLIGLFSLFYLPDHSFSLPKLLADLWVYWVHSILKVFALFLLPGKCSPHPRNFMMWLSFSSGHFSKVTWLLVVSFRLKF